MVQVKRLAKGLGWFVLGVIVLLGIAYGVLLFYQEPVRAMVERQLNSHVQGYHFTLGKTHVYPNLSLDLINLLIVQTTHPDPPVAKIPKWHFSVQWRHIFSGVVVRMTCRSPMMFLRLKFPGYSRWSISLLSRKNGLDSFLSYSPMTT